MVEDDAQLSLLLHHFSSIGGYKVLVHGGGRSATRIASALGIESEMVNGRRITDEAMLRVVTMVWSTSSLLRVSSRMASMPWDSPVPT